MTIYLLNYDLLNETNGTFDYKRLWAELERLGAHRTQYSSWLISLTNTPQEVVSHFAKFVDKDDALWVTRLRAQEHTYVNARAGTTKWLEKNPAT